MLISLLLARLATQPAGADQMLFTPQNGLSGPSHGDGSLRIFLGQPRAFHVISQGQNESDGSFTLKQTIAYAGKAPQTRQWNIQQVTPLRYSGTLSDAAGTVSGHTNGRRLFLRYRIKGPLVMQQTLELMPDGTTINNVGQITLLGIPVGSLHETIRRGN